MVLEETASNEPWATREQMAYFLEVKHLTPLSRLLCPRFKWCLQREIDKIWYFSHRFTEYPYLMAKEYKCVIPEATCNTRVSETSEKIIGK